MNKLNTDLRHAVILVLNGSTISKQLENYDITEKELTSELEEIKERDNFSSFYPKYESEFINLLGNVTASSMAIIEVVEINGVPSDMITVNFSGYINGEYMEFHTGTKRTIQIEKYLKIG